MEKILTNLEIEKLNREPITASEIIKGYRDRGVPICQEWEDIEKQLLNK